jgi:hypothetical protein
MNGVCRNGDVRNPYSILTFKPEQRRILNLGVDKHDNIKMCRNIIEFGGCKLESPDTG